MSSMCCNLCDLCFQIYGFGPTDGPNTAISFINFNRKLSAGQDQSTIDSTPLITVEEKQHDSSLDRSIKEKKTCFLKNPDILLSFVFLIPERHWVPLMIQVNE